MNMDRFLLPLGPAYSDRPFGHIPHQPRKEQMPCKVNIQDEDLTRMKSLAQSANLGPITFENTRSTPNTEFGLTREWINDAVQTWTSESQFDWRKIEANINTVPHFFGRVEHNGKTYSIHYMALFSKRKDALPLVCIHGWPGCFMEYFGIAKLLQSRYTPETLPFHLIVPSLPGYTFSTGPPKDENFSTYDVSCIFRELFRDLQFHTTGYVVAGGDIGSRVARALAADDEACIGINLNFCFDFNMHTFPRDGLNADELRDVGKIDTFIKTGAAYAQMHATRSATIGFVLSSNPVALLAWIGEKFLEWTDVTPDTETILTFVTLYWITDTLPRSIYPYRADFAPGDEIPNHGDSPRWLIPDGKPFGFSHFPKEILPVPRAWVERTGKVTWWREHDEGGHFVGLEVPHVLLGDLEAFVEHVKESRT